MMKQMLIITLMLLTLAVIAACTVPPHPTVEPPPDMPNPASVHCADEGGKLDIRDESGGQVGYCIFPDGSECEEWAFFRGECAPGDKKPLGMPNPASVHCADEGGKSDIRDEAGGQVGYCIFPDGSECEEWAFFKGECAPGGGEGKVGMPNPASVHCADEGGKLEIRDEAGGQVGYCIFPDGSECEEWAFFKGECAPGDKKPIGMPNPASVHCADEGGKLEIRDEAGGQVGYCIFPDGSECEEWAFFKGECAPGDKKPIGMPNPASVHCADEGGKLDIRDEAGGQVGYCIFPDGSECEEWAFFKGECSPGGGEGKVGMPNPASVHCADEGGKLEIRDEAGGQVGYCIFPDGSECEEWAFFKGECAPGGGEGKVGMPNPASVHCADEGGKSDIRDEAGGQVGYCIFPDGSECEEWAFFKGECAPGGSYQPLDSADCTDLANAMSKTVGVEVATDTAAFDNFVTGESGSGCQATATGTGADFESFPKVANALSEMLAARGWTEDMQYAADGPTSTVVGFNQDNGLCLMQVGWEPSDDADCPSDQPISACKLTPEQQLYTIVLNCAQISPKEAN